MLVEFQVATRHQSRACTKGRGASSSWPLLLEECASLINTIWKALFWLICMRELGKGPLRRRIMGALVHFTLSREAVAESQQDRTASATFNMEMTL